MANKWCGYRGSVVTWIDVDSENQAKPGCEWRKTIATNSKKTDEWKALSECLWTRANKEKPQANIQREPSKMQRNENSSHSIPIAELKFDLSEQNVILITWDKRAYQLYDCCLQSILCECGVDDNSDLFVYTNDLLLNCVSAICKSLNEAKCWYLFDERTVDVGWVQCTQYTLPHWR